MKNSSSKANDSVDVLLICALKDEYDEVLKVTDGIVKVWVEHPDANGWMVADATFNTTSGNLLTIRATHASYMGREQVQALASKMIHDNPAKCIAMSGICAGRRGGVNLGDVIFADRLWSYDAGKITVENGKPRFQADPIQFNPSQEWVQRMPHVHKSLNTSWLIERPALTLEYQEAWLILRILCGDDPRQHQDFAAECPDWPDVLKRLWVRQWLEKPMTLTASGRQQAEELHLLHHNGLPKPANFKIHVAPIGTGAAVNEDCCIFDRLAESMRKVLGIEMEASALGALGDIYNIPVVVAKGVSDFGDTLKDDRYRQFAARASAECLISFLRTIIEPCKSANDFATSQTETQPTCKLAIETLKANSAVTKLLKTQLSENSPQIAEISDTADLPTKIVEYLLALEIAELIKTIHKAQKDNFDKKIREVLAKLLLELLPSCFYHANFATNSEYATKIRAAKGNELAEVLEIIYATEISAEILMAGVDNRSASFQLKPIHEENSKKKAIPNQYKLSLPPESGPNPSQQYSDIIEDLFNRFVGGEQDNIEHKIILTQDALFLEAENAQPGYYWVWKNPKDSLLQLAQKLKKDYPYITLLCLENKFEQEREERKLLYFLPDTQDI